MDKTLLEIYNFEKKIRLGRNADGGYVICKMEGEYDCYISCGIGDEASFDKDFINTYKNINKENAFAFDGTIDDYPYNYTNNITFIKKNISFFNDENHTNLEDLIKKYNSIFLSIDIEGGEYDWILSLTEEKLNKFKQICIEFHGLNDDSWGKQLKYKLECLKRLNKTHYIMHAHGNNHSGIKNDIPDVLELTYVNKKYIQEKPIKNNVPFPIKGIDFPNNSSLDDYTLNKYPFVNKL